MKEFNKTDVGMTRSMNQDSLLVSDNNRNGLNLYILSDGMGVYKGGEIAIKVAITAVSKYIIEKFDEIPKDKQSILNLVEDSIEFANSAIYEESEQDEELQDMGTTLEVVLIYKNKVYIGHIGDSRIYRIRKGKMKKITTDHSYVEKLIQDGEITRETSIPISDLNESSKKIISRLTDVLNDKSALANFWDIEIWYANNVVFRTFNSKYFIEGNFALLNNKKLKEGKQKIKVNGMIQNN